MAKWGLQPIGEMIAGGKRWTKAPARWILEIDKEKQVRVDALRVELDIEEQARSRGVSEQPPTDDRTLDEPQLRICRGIFDGILLLNQFLAEQLGIALGKGRDAAPKLLDAGLHRGRMANAVEDVFAEREPEIRKLRQDDLTFRKELRYFKSRHRLTRQASYRESMLLVVGTIFALMVLESFFNGMLFKDVVSGGMAMGAFIALLISAINVLLGVIAGLYGWRFIGHVDRGKKALGIVITAVCHLAAIAWNLAVAQFRNVAEIAAANPHYDFNVGSLTQATAAGIHTNGWFGFASFIAWALFVLGLIVHFYAAKEGWDHFEDRYPDYKKVDLRARTARVDFDDAVADLRADARDAAKAVVDEAAKEEEASREAAGDIASLYDLAVQREKEVRDSEDEWVSGGTLLLRVYRDINIEVRDTEHPAYFDAYPTAADYRSRRYANERVTGDELDRYLVSTDASLKAIAKLRTDADDVVRRNAETIRGLNNEINELLAGLTAKIETARARATEEATAALEEEDIAP